MNQILDSIPEQFLSRGEPRVKWIRDLCRQDADGAPEAACPDRGPDPTTLLATALICTAISSGCGGPPAAPKGARQASAHFKMNAGTAAEVRRELAAAHFTRLQNPPTGTCADCYVYSITYRGHKVVFPTSKVPEGLMEVVDALEGEVIAHLYRHVGYSA